MADAAVGEGGEGVGQLQRRNQHLALADGRDDVVAGGPPPLGEGHRVLLVALPPVGRGGQIAVLLERQGDATFQAQPVGGRRILDGRVEVVGVDVDRLADPVVVDVAGNGEAPDQVHVLVRLLAGVAVATARGWVAGVHVAATPEDVCAGVVPELVGPRDRTHAEYALVPSGMCGEDLERGAGGVLALDRSVEHRQVVGWIVQVGPLLRGEPSDGHVGVVRREGGHRQHVTHPRVQDHHRTTRCAEGGQELAGTIGIGFGLTGAGQVDRPFQLPLHQVLHVDVDRQDHVVAGNRHHVEVLALPDDLAQAVHLHHLAARHAPEVVLEHQLHAGLPDLVAQPVLLARRGSAIPQFPVVYGAHPT